MLNRGNYGCAPVWGLAIVLIVALGSLGVVNSAWTQALTVTGRITTGTLAAAISSTSLQTVDPRGSADCKIDVSTTDSANDTFHLVIKNAYRGYACTGQFKVANRGSVAFKIDRITFEPNTPGDLFKTESGGDCVGQKVDPGAESAGWCQVKVTVRDDAPEGRETFAGSFTVEQWLP